jgi:hypothetical protein
MASGVHVRLAGQTTKYVACRQPHIEMQLTKPSRAVIGRSVYFLKPTGKLGLANHFTSAQKLIAHRQLPE